jgi:Zn-dependent metalloprotease
MVRFLEEFREVPIYASLSAVELDKNNNIVSIQSSYVDYIDLSPEPKINPDKVKDLLIKSQDNESLNKIVKDLDLNPSLYYYYDNEEQKWRLVYITNISIKQKSKSNLLPELVNYIIDAHSGKIVSRLPCVRSLVACP